jgi:hypothetical protein
MPFPELMGEYVDKSIVNGHKCNHFIYQDYSEIIHIYIEESTGNPVRLVQEYIENGISTPLLTYDYSDVSQSPIDESVFSLPSPYEHSTCDRIVGGFPYLHIFHHFVRF